MKCEAGREVVTMDSPPPTVVKTCPSQFEPTTGVAGETNELNDPALNVWTVDCRSGSEAASRAMMQSTGGIPQ